MPTPQEQAQAEAAEAAEAERVRAEEERRRQAAQGSGLWDWFKSFLPDFSFFNILLFAAVACGAYFLGRTEGGKELLGNIFGRENVDAFFSRGDTMLAGLASGLGINIDISERLEAMPIEEVRTTLASQNIPHPIIAIVAKDETTFHQFLQVVKAANGGRIGLNDFMNDRTITALATHMPDLVRALAASATRATPGGAPNPMADQIKATLLTIINGEQLNTLLSPANRANTVALMMTVTPADAGITAATLNALISRNVAANGTPSPELRRLLTAAVDGSLHQLQASVTGADGTFSSTKAIEALLNPQTRALIRSFGTGNIALALRDKSPELSKELLDASLTFGDAIDKNPANNGANRPRTLAVLRAVARMGEGVEAKEAFKGITAEQLSGFFQVPGNQEAVGNLLRVVQPSVARHWGNAEHGLAEVLASTPDTANILRIMRGDSTWYETLGANAADLFNLSMETRLRYAGGGKIAENAADLAALMPQAGSTARRPAARG